MRVTKVLQRNLINILFYNIIRVTSSVTIILFFFAIKFKIFVFLFKI